MNKSITEQSFLEVTLKLEIVAFATCECSKLLHVIGANQPVNHSAHVSQLSKQTVQIPRHLDKFLFLPQLVAKEVTFVFEIG